ncbi:ABC transporter ATP-binding protein [Leifsonia sp. A12D58]|uniref:ABC transporter ATP-binding protein n=1 Tax=Leifsonia sp. A12D58 TaxID=3397674 RepID=UPI0039DFB1D7
MDTIIETTGLQKHFGRVRALDGLDLHVAAGEVHGFLGPNGAGKSTTIRILLGLARATGGSATLFGQDPWNDAVELHRRIASVPGDVSLWPNLTGGEAIDLISRLRGGTADRVAYAARKARLLDVFQLDPKKKGRSYSKGNRQKVALVAAFATPAELYLLDEPTSGLDPLMEVIFNEEIRRVSGEGATVLLSSHILSEVEQLCDRVSIIRAGKTVQSGTLVDLRQLTRTEISFSAATMTPERLTRLAAQYQLSLVADRVHFTVESSVVVTALPLLAELDVQGLTVAPPSLEELFLREYSDAPAGQTTQSELSAKDTQSAQGAHRS